MKRTSMFVAATLAATLVAPSAPADEPAAGTDAMRVMRDKQTGQLRAPNNEELQQLLEAEKATRKARGAANTLPQQTTVRTHASGMKSATLGEEHLVQVVATRDETGKVVVQHANPAHEHVQPAAELATE
jgi:hypothetical protein